MSECQFLIRADLSSTTIIHSLALQKEDTQNDLILTEFEYSTLLDYTADLRQELSRLRTDAGDFLQDRKKAREDADSLRCLQARLGALNDENSNLNHSLEAQKEVNLM